jgi:DNA ligase (NAD+)
MNRVDNTSPKLNLDLDISSSPSTPVNRTTISPALQTKFDFHQDELAFLKQQGFPINPHNSYAKNIEEIWEVQAKLQAKRHHLSYNIDGLVVKLNNNQLVQDLGVVGKTPRGWCAVKFPAEEVTTKLLDIMWQVGRTGRVTPVANLEPVSLAGTTVKRASLHNYKEILERDMKPGDMVVIRKAGDIIPEVIQVLKNLRTTEIEQSCSFRGPSYCPACQTKLILSETGVDLICPNDEHCPAQVLGRLTYFTQRSVANITGLSDKILERFVKEYTISDIPDLYDLPFEKIHKLEGFGDKSAENIQRAVEKARYLDAPRFLAGLAIEGVGLEVAKLICEALVDSEKNQTELF